MKAYVLSIAGVVLVTAALGVVAPSGKTGRFIKGMGKLFLLVVMLAPFVSFVSGKNSFAFESDTTAISIDGAYMESCAQMLCEEDERQIICLLGNQFGITAEVEVERGRTSDFPREKITVKITDFGIIGQEEHIYMIEQVHSELEKRYGCEAVVT